MEGKRVEWIELRILRTEYKYAQVVMHVARQVAWIRRRFLQHDALSFQHPG